MPSWEYQRVSSTPGHSWKVAPADSMASTHPASVRAAGLSWSVLPEGCAWSTSMSTRAPAAWAASSIMPVSRASSWSSCSSGLKRRSMENHAEPGTTLKPAPAPACPPTTSIEPAASSLSTGKLVRFSSSSCESALNGSAIRIMCSKAFTPSCTYPTCASRPDVRTRSVIAPRHACQITPPVGAAVQQAELASGGGAVQHGDKAALHVRRPAPGDPPVAAHWLELRGALRGDHVEVPVEVDDLGPRAGAAAHDRRSLEAPGRRELDQLG